MNFAQWFTLFAYVAAIATLVIVLTGEKHD